MRWYGLGVLACVGCSEVNLSSLGEGAEGVSGAPVADAGPDQSVAPGQAAVVDGSASHDPNGLEPLTFQWTLVSWPDGSSAQVTGMDQPSATVQTDLAGDYVLELGVMNTDGVWDATPDRVVVTAPAGAVEEPVADAGPDQTVEPLDTVALDGLASYDPQGLDLVDFQWSWVSKPAGSTAVILRNGTARPEFFADLAGDYVLDLAVQNEDGAWDSTPDQVVVTAEPLDYFYVQLSWNAGSDLDLHLMDAGYTIFENPGDCNFCNQTPAWGAAGAADNPSLDWDAINGYGPETITIDDPASSTYTVAVHYYGLGGADSCAACPASTATVDIYLNGVVAASFTETLTDDNDLWTVATIDWPSGQITEVGAIGATPKTVCF